MHRQGDVLLVLIEGIPGDAIEQDRDYQGRLVIAEGEATGHAHVIRDNDVRLYRSSDGPLSDKLFEICGMREILYLDAPGGFTLEHLKGLSPTGEHDPITFPAGVYAYGPQVEYNDSEEWVRVTD